MCHFFFKTHTTEHFYATRVGPALSCADIQKQIDNATANLNAPKLYKNPAEKDKDIATKQANLKKVQDKYAAANCGR